MKLLTDSDTRFRNLPIKLTAFVLVALLGALGVLGFLAERQGYFAEKTPLFFVSDTGTDLKEGMAVKFSDFKIGSVRNLTLDDRGRVTVNVLIENRYLKWIKQDSIGRVRRDGPIGDTFIDVGLGSANLPPVKKDTQLEFIPAKSFDDLVREVQAKVVPVVDEAQALMRKVNDPQGDFSQTLLNLRQVSVGLAETRAKLDRMLDNTNKLMEKDVPATLAVSRHALDRLDHSLQLVDSRVPQLLDTAQRALVNVEGASGSAKRVLDEAGPDVVGLIRDGRDLARKGNETVDAVTGAWPLNKLLAPPVGRPLRSDSQE